MGTKPFTSDPVTAMKFCVLLRTLAERDGCSYTEARLIVRHDRPGVFEKPAPTSYKLPGTPSELDAPTIAANRTESATVVSLQSLLSPTSPECLVTRCYQGHDAPCGPYPIPLPPFASASASVRMFKGEPHASRPSYHVATSATLSSDGCITVCGAVC